MLLISGVSQLEAKRLAAPSCRWCEPPKFDQWVRQELRWTDTKAAGNISNVLVFAIPAGAALTLGLAARADGAGSREVAEDLLVLTEAASVTVLLTQVSKFATARLRPDAWGAGGGGTTDSRMSFWAGHTAFSFSVAAGATQVARLRGRTGWKWLALATFGGAAAMGWLRISADRHWATDVVAGAAVGTAAGLAVPLLVMRPADERGTAVTLVPAPGGLALLF
jgi:membrane-associated phospholipid phosphatase